MMKIAVICLDLRKVDGENMIDFSNYAKIKKEAREVLKSIDETYSDSFTQLTIIQSVQDLEVAKQVIGMLVQRNQLKK